MSRRTDMDRAGQEKTERAPRSVELRDLGVLSMVAIYLVVTAWLSLELNVWRDEMYSLSTTSGSVGRAARRAIEFELQPPVYFALLAAWRKANDSIFFARMLSSLFGAGAILTAVALARRLVPQVRPVYVAALLATHPFLVWAGTEVRVYALVVLLSAVLTLAFIDVYWLGGSTLRARLVFGGVALVALYTQYYLVLLLFCFGIATLVRGDRRRFFAYALDAGVVALLSVPLVLAIRAQLGSHRGDLGRPLAFGAETLRFVVARFEAYLFSFNDAIDKVRWSLGTIRAARWAYRAVILTAMVVGALRLRRLLQGSVDEARLTRGVGRRALPVVAGIGAYAVCMAGLLALVGPMSVGERHTAGLLVPALLAVVAAPAAALGRGAAQAWASLLVASNVGATALIQIGPMAKDCDCRHVAEAIAERETRREAILVFPAEDAMPLSVYYRGPNRLLPVPRAASLDRWDQSEFVIESPREVGELLDREAPGADGLWVHTNTYGPSWGQEKLEAFLANGYREDDNRAFSHGVVLRHFVRQKTGRESRGDPRSASGSSSVTSP